jgi:hypothetical protein
MGLQVSCDPAITRRASRGACIPYWDHGEPRQAGGHA